MRAGVWRERGRATKGVAIGLSARKGDLWVHFVVVWCRKRESGNGLVSLKLEPKDLSRMNISVAVKCERSFKKERWCLRSKEVGCGSRGAYGVNGCQSLLQ